MAWKITENRLGQSLIGGIDDSAKVPVGTVVTAVDDSLGGGEFIYLKGVASTVINDVVTYDVNFLTVRAAAGNSLPRPVAFAMGAVVANKWGWYQIGGVAYASKTKTISMAAGIAVGVSTTAKVIHSSSVKEISGCLVAVVASATTTTNNGERVALMVNRPMLQGRIT